MAVTEAQAFMCLLRAGPLRKLLEKQPPQTNEVKMLPHVAEGRVRVLVNNSTVRTEGELPVASFEVE